MNDYSALYDVSRRANHPLGEKVAFTVGRSADADLPVMDPGYSPIPFCVHRIGKKFAVEPLSAANPTYYNERVIAARTSLVHGDVLRAGSRPFRFLERSIPEVGCNSVTESASPSTRTVLPPPLPPMRPSVRPRTVLVQGPEEPVPSELIPVAIGISGIMLVGREAARVQIHLDHPHVSRIHALVEIDEGCARVSDMRSANDTFVNGRRIDLPTPIRIGDRIDIGPFSLVFTGTALVPQTRAENVEVIARADPES